MMSRKSFVTALGAVLGLTLIVAMASGVSAMGAVDRLTFSGPVGLPGVTLGAGTYMFEIINPNSGADVILVRERATRRVCFLGLTNRTDRPLGSEVHQAIALGESPRGVAPPILAWYPSGDLAGHAFIYR